MRLHLAALLVAVAATFAGPGADRAGAQVVAINGTPVSWSGPSSAPSFGMGMEYAPAFVADAVPRFPYSYYAAFPMPARQYVSYGPNDAFPFRGTPYGLPNDRWSWSTLAGPSSSLQRYYYPPVR